MKGQRLLLNVIILACSLPELGCGNSHNDQVRQWSVPTPTQHLVSVSSQEQVVQYLASAAERLLIPVDESEQVTFIHQNHLGSNTLLSDSTGQEKGRWAYTPYGSFRDATGEHPVYGFSNQEHDLSTGLLHFKYRYLDITTGRWLQVDPLYGLSTSKKMEKHGEATTAYAYVGNQAINQIDPSGLEGKLAVKGQKAKLHKRKSKVGRKKGPGVGAKVKALSSPQGAAGAFMGKTNKLKSITDKYGVGTTMNFVKQAATNMAAGKQMTLLGRIQDLAVVKLDGALARVQKGLDKKINVLDDPAWTMDRNDEFVNNAKESGGPIYAMSPNSAANIKDPTSTFSETVYSRELRQVVGSKGQKAGSIQKYQRLNP